MIQQSLCDAVKEKHWRGDFSFTNAVLPVFANDSSTEGPIWVMHGSHFCSEALIQGESLFFFRGNSSCLAALIQAGWLYLHTYSNKEACNNSRKGSRFVFNRTPTTELKQADATSYGWNLHLRQVSFSHLTNYF